MRVYSSVWHDGAEWFGNLTFYSYNIMVKILFNEIVLHLWRLHIII